MYFFNYIYCLQDMHFTHDLESYIKTQWGYKCLFNSFTSNVRGVAIMLNNTFEYKINKIKTDNSGKSIILDITVNKQQIPLKIYIWTK